MRDPLTGLATYAFFFERAEDALRDSDRDGHQPVIFSVDLDHFHHINDDHGHEAGNAVLVAVADRLRTALHRHDAATLADSAICRVGGDEFLVLCGHVEGHEDAEMLATEMLDALAAPIELRSGSVYASARIGSAVADADADAQQMILNAETAQHHTRHIAGDRYQVFTSELREPRIRLEQGIVEAMQLALLADEFCLVYQPKVSLTTNRIVGVEALLRWERPGVGTVYPGEFIPAAELSGMIVPIGEWVMLAAFRQAALWHRQYPRTSVEVAINVSARQFQAGLVRTIRRLLDETGVNASAICLELTESTLMTDIRGSIGILNELKAMGFKISIDDYGTGYSSLEYLHRMPIDELKIDRSFVAGLGENSDSNAIVASIISLAQTLNQEVVAEGVETREQLERIRTMGCDFAQGFLIAHPVPAFEIDDYLTAHATGQTLIGADPGIGDATFAPWVGESVLIVDSSDDVRMLARMCLTAAGFIVEEGSSGSAALASARDVAPACVLLSMDLPEVSGVEVCRQLRSGLTTKECTIVMVTGRSEGVDKAEAFLAGADDYIVKPFTPRDLVTRVRAAIDRRRKLVESMGGQVDQALFEMLRALGERDDESSLIDDDALSTRQIEILRRVLSGQRVSEIAAELFLSQSTVRNHLSAIFQKFGVHSQTELLRLLRKRSVST